VLLVAQRVPVLELVAVQVPVLVLYLIALAPLKSSGCWPLG
jgi:hypothetical protein